MEIVVDSHALFWFLTANEKLSPRARRMIEHAQIVIVPSIVVMEILYILEKNSMSVRFIELLGELKAKNYLVYPLDLEIISQTVSVTSGLEMHDRIIVATATYFNAPLISRDSEIKRVYEKTIW